MNDNSSSFGSKLELIKASDIKPKQVRWLWYPYIPFGKVTLLQGDPGDGKSKLMLSLAALLSKGAPLPFSDDEESYEPVTIIYQTTEDDADDSSANGKPRGHGSRRCYSCRWFPCPAPPPALSAYRVPYRPKRWSSPCCR